MDESHFNHVFMYIHTHIAHISCTSNHPQAGMRYSRVVVKKYVKRWGFSSQSKTPSQKDVNDTPASTAFNDFLWSACSN